MKKLSVLFLGGIILGVLEYVFGNAERFGNFMVLTLVSVVALNHKKNVQEQFKGLADKTLSMQTTIENHTNLFINSSQKMTDNLIEFNRELSNLKTEIAENRGELSSRLKAAAVSISKFQAVTKDFISRMDELDSKFGRVISIEENHEKLMLKLKEIQERRHEPKA